MTVSLFAAMKSRQKGWVYVGVVFNTEWQSIDVPRHVQKIIDQMGEALEKST